MKNNKKKERSIIILLIVAVLLMTVGFALYTQTLNINGSVTVKGKPWDVRYVSGTVTPTTGSVTATDATVTDTNFSFTVTLEKPGDFYEATITAKNFGTVPAKLTGITMSTLTAEQQKYLSYTVTYNGTAYTASDTNLNVALAANATHLVKVRVEYKQPADANDLPSTNQTINVTGSLAYQDALPAANP